MATLSSGAGKPDELVYWLPSSYNESLRTSTNDEPACHGEEAKVTVDEFGFLWMEMQGG